MPKQNLFSKLCVLWQGWFKYCLTNSIIPRVTWPTWWWRRGLFYGLISSNIVGVWYRVCILLSTSEKPARRSPPPRWYGLANTSICKYGLYVEMGPKSSLCRIKLWFVALAKNQSSASLALCGEFTGGRWIPRTKGHRYAVEKIIATSGPFD